MKYLSRFISWTMNNLYLVPNISIHNVHFNGFSTVWVCSCFLSGLISRSSCHTLNIWKASLLCGFKFLQAACLWECLHTLRGFELLLSCMGPLIFLLWSDLQKLLSHLLHQGTWYWKHLSRFVQWIESLKSGSSHGFSSNLMLRSSCHSLCTWMASLPCELSHVPSSGQLLKSSCHTLSS